jgi:hypothetical protein
MSNEPEILKDVDALKDALGVDGDDNSHLHCPFHGTDEHGSLSVYVADESGRARYMCHTCGAAGTLIDAVMARDHCEVGAAMAKLALIDVNYVSPRPLQGKPRKIFKTEADLYRAVDRMASSKGMRVAHVHYYTNPATGVHEQIVFRMETALDGQKEILPARSCDGGYSFGAAPEPRPIYNRAGIMASSTVVIVEGEKCADTFPIIGITTPATTSPGGSKAAAKADLSPLVGKTVIIWPDNDEPGRLYANDVIEKLSQLDPRPTVRVIDVAPLNLPEGGDVVDLFERLLNTEGLDRAGVTAAVQAVLDGAQLITLPAPAPNPVQPVAVVLPAPAIPRPVSPPIPSIPAPPTVPVVTTLTSMPPPLISPPAPPATATYAPAPVSGVAGLHQVLSDAIAGRRYPIQMPWPLLSRATRALLPATVTGLAGSPGATKSFAALQLVTHTSDAGIPTALLEMEDGAPYHMRRALAQLAGESELTDDEWCRANPLVVRRHEQTYQTQLVKLASAIHVPPPDQPATAALLVDWVRRQAEAGARVIVIDPITAMAKTRFGWIDDESFLWGAKRIIEKHGASLVLVTHPPKLPPGARIKDLTADVIAGGVCYRRFSQTLLFLACHEPKVVSLIGAGPMAVASINRTLTIIKARDGRGVEGQQFGFEFSAQSLTLIERGRIK